MAFADYGAVVKKNGKIITDPNGGFFQNFSTLKYKNEGHYIKNDQYVEGSDEPDEIWVDDEDNCDETIIKLQQEDGSFEDYSIAGNYFATIGDRNFLIGFYKCDFLIAINGETRYDDSEYGAKSIHQHFWHENRKKPLEMSIDYNGIHYTNITVSFVDRKWKDVFKAVFTYNGDKYEVIFGYGVDSNPEYLYGKDSYFAPHRDYWDKRIYHKCASTRGLLRRLKEWYEK